jgi:hypothetical protein
MCVQEISIDVEEHSNTGEIADLLEINTLLISICDILTYCKERFVVRRSVVFIACK